MKHTSNIHLVSQQAILLINILLINPIFDIHYAVSCVSNVDHIMDKVLMITVSV